jgi:F0F1-type ATP synthase membrane subunit b/b'
LGHAAALRAGRKDEVDLSAEGIAAASFDEVASGGFDRTQVHEFLAAVGGRVAELERQIVESDDMRRATMELLEQAEALVDEARERARLAGTAEDGGRVQEATHEAERIIADAEARAAAETFISFELLADEAHDLRRDAERRVTMAAVEAARIVSDAEERAERILRGAPDDAVAAPAGAVAEIVAEAEGLLEEARQRAEGIVAEASTRATDLRTRADLSEEIHRAIGALRAVSGARGGSSDADVIGDVRGRAVQLLGEVRRADTRLAPARRADLLDQLAELQGIVGRIEARLIGRDRPRDTTDDVEVVVDLTDDTTEAEPGSGRPSRYQQRSANLPTIGTDVADVNRAVHSMRQRLPDRDLRDDE